MDSYGAAAPAPRGTGLEASSVEEERGSALEPSMGQVSSSSFPRRRCMSCEGAAWVLGAAIVGLAIGLGLSLSDITSSGDLVSNLLGWTYFTMWSCSFYPQVFLNFRTKSVAGLSLDYQLLNLAGFTCYFLFNASLYWDPTVREEYRSKHGGKDSAVQLNDVFFAGHAAVITSVTLTQICIYYDYPPLDPPARRLRSAVVLALSLLTVASVLITAINVFTQERMMTWLSLLSALAQAKVVISVLKYMPQVWMNHRRRSTQGWNIANVLLDFSGGSLSVAQLLFDAGRKHDWSAVKGDPVKLLLGNLSMFFDIVFMVQHYCLYSDARLRREANKRLLAHDAQQARARA